MKAILANGSELNPILVTGEARYVQGQSRDTLSFIFPGEVDMTELDKAFTSEACESIRLIGDDSESIHQAYTIRSELSKKLVEVSANPQKYEERITVAMSQRTVMENKILELEQRVAALTYLEKSLANGVTEIVKKNDEDMPSGDYTHPITYVIGMTVTTGLFYSDGENVWEAIKDGTPDSFEDEEYFDIIEA